MNMYRVLVLLSCILFTSAAGHYGVISHRYAGGIAQAIDETPKPYQFAYQAGAIGGDSSRQESADGSGAVSGSYSLSDEDGRKRVVEYVADGTGFRASVKTNEPGTKSESPADAPTVSDAAHTPVDHTAPAAYSTAYRSPHHYGAYGSLGYKGYPYGGAHYGGLGYGRHYGGLGYGRHYGGALGYDSRYGGAQGYGSRYYGGALGYGSGYYGGAQGYGSRYYGGALGYGSGYYGGALGNGYYGGVGGIGSGYYGRAADYDGRYYRGVLGYGKEHYGRPYSYGSRYYGGALGGYGPNAYGHYGGFGGVRYGSHYPSGLGHKSGYSSGRKTWLL